MIRSIYNAEMLILLARLEFIRTQIGDEELDPGLADAFATQVQDHFQVLTALSQIYLAVEAVSPKRNATLAECFLKAFEIDETQEGGKRLAQKATASSRKGRA